MQSFQKNQKHSTFHVETQYISSNFVIKFSCRDLLNVIFTNLLTCGVYRI